MTGIAELYLCLKRPHSKDARERFAAMFKRDHYGGVSRFVVLSWKRTGSNLLCGILHGHPEITMHNELFNPIDIFTYHPKVLKRIDTEDGNTEKNWTFLGRDLWPEAFLEHIWTGKYANGTPIKNNHKAIGFKSFPDHWVGAKNQKVWETLLLRDHRVKKIILHREDELAVYVSMKRAEVTGHYMTLTYPKDLRLEIDIVRFQIFVNNYHDTFQRKYKSPMEGRDTFRISYEQLIQDDSFEKDILPLLWKFLGVDEREPARRLKETVKQSDKEEDYSKVISNFSEVEFAFRHTDITYFKKRADLLFTAGKNNDSKMGLNMDKESEKVKDELDGIHHMEGTWSILLPICSRVTNLPDVLASDNAAIRTNANENRFIDLTRSSAHVDATCEDGSVCWGRVEKFAASLKQTSSAKCLSRTECLVGIDIDDKIFGNPAAKERIKSLLPCQTVFVDIPEFMYGKVCRIWSHLGSKAKNDYIVLLGDDIELLDNDWQDEVENCFHQIHKKTGLPFGVGCVAIRDTSFPGFPTFPVVHKWHIQHFDRLLPKQFVNQGGDPYLYELYSRFNASMFVEKSRLCNTVGGDGDARYAKYSINWQGQVLLLSILRLTEKLNCAPKGICLDVVVPSYRTNNNDLLQKIISLRASIDIYVRFWLVVDNPIQDHIDKVKALADEANTNNNPSNNYFVNVVHYGSNRGASYARNTGYNYSTADWILFLDDDVVPDHAILDAYAGAIMRYPDAKVFVGLTELPAPFNFWTEILSASNVMFFYGVSKSRIHPPWGVTANLLVRGSRHNHTIQFKDCYPKTGGGEDIDFVFQMKEWYKDLSNRCVVAVAGAKASHPWWNNGGVCYQQIRGWAWGDSLCLLEWPNKTYLCAPNWIECIFVLLPVSIYMSNVVNGLQASFVICIIDHLIKAITCYSRARIRAKNCLMACIVAIVAGTVISSQEITRVVAMIYRISPFCFARRMDWFDGQAKIQVLDEQLRSCFKFGLYLCVVWWLLFVKEY